MNDFDFLLADGNVGFYNKCEVIEIFGINTNDNKTFNIFTLIVFEDTTQCESEEFITQKLESFKQRKDLKWGIKKRIISLEKVRSIFNDLKNEGLFKITDEILTGQLQFSNKQYIQPNDSFISPQLNNVLKNNFHTGSHLIEGFDNTKENTRFLLDNPELLNDFSEKVSQIIPISIGSLSDRLGNVIFQFPINIFKIQVLTLGINEGFQLDFAFNPRLEKEPALQVIAKTTLDNAVLDCVVQDIKNNTPVLMNTHEAVELKVFNKENNLIVYKNSFVTVKNIVISSGIVNPQNRFFSVGDKQYRISVTHARLPNTIGEQDNKQSNWIYNRKYDQELKGLEQSKSFIQYKRASKDKAINDIRELINQHGRDGVYLWDPYLSALDIKNTLYFCKSTNVELKAITAKKGCKSSDVNEFKKDDKEYLLLNLEVRKQSGNHGDKFHDRFLIFPLEKPKVWSLGTSVNSLGKDHHIMQEVQHAQHILNAFNELWEELNHEECLVWKSM